jgi:hypothetical protein
MAGRRDRIESPPVEARLHVEREDAKPWDEVRGLEARVPVDAPDARAPLEVSLHGERRADPAVDQEAVGEAHVGLEGLDPCRGEPGPERGNVAGNVDLDPEDGLAPERQQRGLGHPSGGGDLAQRVPVGGADVAVGSEPVVHDEGGLAALEDGVEVHLRPAVGHAVGRGQNEAAHVLRLPQGRAGPRGGRGPVTSRRVPWARLGRRCRRDRP